MYREQYEGGYLKIPTPQNVVIHLTHKTLILFQKTLTVLKIFLLHNLETVQSNIVGNNYIFHYFLSLTMSKLFTYSFG